MREKIVHKTLKQMEYEWKDELVNQLYAQNFYFIEEYNKHIEILDKIKEYIKENANANVDYILELLEEIE